MAIARLLQACGASLLIAGCAIHPVPKDVTGYDTHVIVAKIRCEMRDAIRTAIIKQLGETNPSVAQQLSANPNLFENFPLARLSPTEQALIGKYDQGAIGYEFTFDMTEINNINATLGFVDPLARGPFGLGFGAGNDRGRQNIRNFRMLDIAGDLVTTYKSEHCSPGERGANWMYPITGRIGLDELVWTFFKLNQEGTLIGPKEDLTPALADTIEFTTKVSANATPSIELVPLGRSFQVAGAGLTAVASRQDKHKVVIALTLPQDKLPPKPSAPPKAGASTPKRASEPALSTFKRSGSRRDVEPEGRAAARTVLDELRFQRDRNFSDRLERLQRGVDDLDP